MGFNILWHALPIARCYKSTEEIFRTCKQGRKPSRGIFWSIGGMSLGNPVGTLVTLSGALRDPAWPRVNLQYPAGRYCLEVSKGFELHDRETKYVHYMLWFLECVLTAWFIEICCWLFDQFMFVKIMSVPGWAPTPYNLYGDKTWFNSHYRKDHQHLLLIHWFSDPNSYLLELQHIP